MTSPEDVDYAKGYYDGVQQSPCLGMSISYLRGHEDGRYDIREFRPWSKEKQIKVMEAYTMFVTLREELQ